MKKSIVRYVIRQIILTVLSTSGIYNYFRRKHRDKVRIMLYHDIISDELDLQSDYNYNTTITRSRFAQQVKYICKHYTPITLNEFIEWKTQNKELPHNPVLFTFDDGHANLYHHAIPILNQYNIKGVFFIKSNSFGKIEQNYCERFLSYASSYKEGRQKYDLFRSSKFEQQISLIQQVEKDNIHHDLNKEKYLHLNINECRFLLQNGHSLASHSVHHYILSSLNDKDSMAEIQQSKQQLEQLLEIPISCFAYPFGDPRHDFSEREKSYLKKAGYIMGFSGEGGRKEGVSRNDENFSIPRFGDVNHDFLYFKLLLSPIRLLK